MIEGGCNCGAVRYTIDGPVLAVAACHCTRCRRQSGSIYSVNLLVAPAAMTITGALKTYEDTDTSSGLPVQREFCGSCGSPIRSIIGANPDMVAIKAGTLDDPAGSIADVRLRPTADGWQHLERGDGGARRAVEREELRRPTGAGGGERSGDRPEGGLAHGPLDGALRLER